MKHSILALTLIAALSGCTSTKPTVLKTSDTRGQCSVQEGTIIDVQEITIRRQPEAAQAGGAIAGGYVGNRITRGQDELIRSAATVGGAIAGAVAGDMAGRAFLDEPGLEIVVKTSTGTTSIAQAVDPDAIMAPGMRVWVIGAQRSHKCGGGVRVVPYNAHKRYE